MVGELRRGISIAETLVSFFLLGSAMLVVVILFHSSLVYQRDLDRRGQALLAASQRLGEIRTWARTPTNFASNWAAFQGIEVTDPNGIRVRSDCVATGREIYSPCRSLELSHLPDARVMRRSVIPVRIRARWGASAQQQVELHTLIGQPVPPLSVRQASVLTLGPTPATMAANATSPITLTGVDGSGLSMSDFFYTWSIQSLGGNGSFQGGSARDGRSTVLQNNYQFSISVPPAPVEGNVTLEAATRYHGTPIKVQSGLVRMLP